ANHAFNGRASQDQWESVFPSILTILVDVILIVHAMMLQWSSLSNSRGDELGGESQNNGNWPPLGTGGRKRDVLNCQSRRVRPRRLAARRKRLASRSA